MDIALALGGGGAKGNAHIGVLRQLEKKDFRVKAIAGTSFGGLVAVFYAIGYSPDEIEEVFAAADQTRFYGHAPDDGPSLMGLAGVARLLEEHLDDLTFADLRIPCVLTAVDLKSGREVLLTQGSLVEAILATIALPGVFPVRHIDGLELVDGGALDPVPVAPVRMLAPRLPIVAVVLNMPMGSPAQPWNIPIGKYWTGMILSRLFSKMHYASAWDVFSRALDVTARAMTQYRLEMDRPDIIIRPQVHDIKTLGIVDVHEVVKRGEAAAEEALPRLKSLFTLRNRWRRSMGAYNHRSLQS
jgi:NTE family protein